MRVPRNFFNLRRTGQARKLISFQLSSVWQKLKHSATWQALSDTSLLSSHCCKPVINFDVVYTTFPRHRPRAGWDYRQRHVWLYISVPYQLTVSLSCIGFHIWQDTGRNSRTYPALPVSGVSLVWPRLNFVKISRLEKTRIVILKSVMTVFNRFDSAYECDRRTAYRFTASYRHWSL